MRPAPEVTGGRSASGETAACTGTTGRRAQPRIGRMPAYPGGPPVLAMEIATSTRDAAMSKAQKMMAM